LTASLSHELNSPLTGILANSQAGLRLLAQQGADPAELRAIFDPIVRDDKRAASVISNLRLLLRREEPAREPVDIADAIGEVIALFKGELEANSVQIRCLTKREAAEYLGIGITMLESLRVPAVHFGRRCVYNRVDLDAWLEDCKRQGRAGKEIQWPVKQESIDEATPASGGFQQRYRTAGAYAKALGLKTEAKPKPSSPS
jgi:hypothetical protein